MTFTTVLSKATKLSLATLMAVSSLLVISVTPALAAVQTCTWTGATNSNFATAGNWSGCGGSTPLAGDILNFTVSGNTVHTLTNGLNLAFGGITFGNGSQGVSTNTTYILNNLRLADGATINRVNAQNLTYSNVNIGFTTNTSLVTDGAVTTNHLEFDNCDASYSSRTLVTSALTYIGSGLSTLVQGGGGMGADCPDIKLASNVVTVNAGAEYGLSGTETNVTIQNGGRVYLSSTPVVATNFILNGSSVSGANLVNYGNNVATLSGSITLNSDAYYYIFGVKTIKVTGTLSGSGSFKKANGSTGTFVNNATTNNTPTPSGEQVVPVEEIAPVTDSKPNESLDILPKTSLVLDGARGYVTVGEGAFLKGNGTVENLSVYSNGTVAPGHSPGKLTVQERLYLGEDATYQTELQDKDLYDQLQVSAADRTTGNDVTITDSILDLKLFSDYKINKGEMFTIINNLQPASQKVVGTFAGLAEGATIAVGTASFSISYVGGDGNDVVLTALTNATAPATPDTGFALLQNNPIATLAVVAIAAGFILVVARRQAVPVRSSRKK